MQCTKQNQYFLIESLRRNAIDATEIYQMVSTAWPNECLSVRRIRELCQEMRSGDRTDFNRTVGSGRKSSELRSNSVDQVEQLIIIDPSMSVQRIADHLHIPHTMVQRILTDDLGKKWIATKWIPHHLTEANQALRVERCSDLIEAMRSRQCRSNLITIDEKWFYCRNMAPKSQIGQWVTPGGDQPKLQTARRTTMEKKIMAIIAVSQSGHHYYEILTLNNSINAERYIVFLENLLRFLSTCKPYPILPENARILHDNARPHTARATANYLNDHNVRLLKQPPYSPDTNLCDRYIFPRLEGKRSVDLNSIDELDHFLSAELPKFTANRMAKALDSMVNDMTKIVEQNGLYL